MGRLQPLDPGDPGLDPAAAQFLGSLSALLGDHGVPNILATMAHHPEASAGFLQFATAAYALNSLRPSHRELAYLTASSLNRCHY